MSLKLDIQKLALAGLIVAIIFGAAFWYHNTELNRQQAEIEHLSNNVDSLATSLASTTALLQASIEETEIELAEALANEQARVESIRSQLGDFQNEVGTIAGTVTNLTKLSQTDPELLQKYSKVFFLNEHYQPTRLVEIPDKYKYSEQRTHRLHEQVWPYAKQLMDDAEAAGEEIYIFSAYRSFEEQRVINDAYSIRYGEGTANTFSADQGFSEHQLGTTIDFITTGIGGTLAGFETTSEYAWLQNNAHRYGFVLSYPENNDYYIFEPWHWRFVGVKLATDLHNRGTGFYDLPQREIDEYLVHLFE